MKVIEKDFINTKTLSRKTISLKKNMIQKTLIDWCLTSTSCSWCCV